MKVICAWCSLVLTPGSTPEAPVSHGICRECAARMIEQDNISVSVTATSDVWEPWRDTGGEG